MCIRVYLRIGMVFITCSSSYFRHFYRIKSSIEPFQMPHNAITYVIYDIVCACMHVLCVVFIGCGGYYSWVCSVNRVFSLISLWMHIGIGNVKRISKYKCNQIAYTYVSPWMVMGFVLYILCVSRLFAYITYHIIIFIYCELNNENRLSYGKISRECK